MIEEPRNEEPGAAIDPEGLAALASEFEEVAPESAAELMEPEGPATAELLQPLVDFACQIGCPNWHIGDKERQALAQAYADLLDKYYPNAADNLGVELNAGLMTVAIFGPRIASRRPARVVAEQKPEKETGEAVDEG